MSAKVGERTWEGAGEGGGQAQTPRKAARRLATEREEQRQKAAKSRVETLPKKTLKMNRYIDCKLQSKYRNTPTPIW
jgi:hypothetical protein